MNREIKFRGKDLDNGGWAVGSYINAELQNGIAHEMVPYKRGEPVVEVDPETVGQYTGLKDRNETEVYEGDIIRHGELFEIRYEDGCFWRSNEGDTMELHTILGMGEFEVIGNIHDNPELIRASSPTTVILDALPHLEWMAENLTGHGGTEVNGNWYYTWEQAIAAAAELGDGWRLPTREEFVKLSDLGSTWDDELRGRWFGGNHDPDHVGSLFFPASGSRIAGSGDLAYFCALGGSWSSSPSADNPAYASLLVFRATCVYPLGSFHRTFGFPVRLVRDIKTE